MASRQALYRTALVILLTGLISGIVFGEKKAVLFLYSSQENSPWIQSVRGGTDDAIAATGDWDLYTENLDRNRLDKTLSNDDWSAYIELKYQSVHFDAVIAESLQASAFINNYGEDLFGDIPRILHTNKSLDERANSYYLKSQADRAVNLTFSMAVSQNPARKEIVIIDGGLPAGRQSIERIKTLSGQLNYKFSTISDFSVEELMDSIRNLTGDEIVFFFLTFKDRTGAQVVPKELLEKVCSVSRAPVYTFWSSLLGTGTVGGVMVDGRTTGFEMVRAITDFSETGAFKENYQTIQSFLEWKTVEHYRLDLSELPPDLIILNRPEPVF